MPDADVVAAQRRRARMLLELGRADEALAEVRRILATHPNDPESLEIAGLCHLRRRDLPAALETLGRAIAAAPDAPHPHYLYGFALREAGRPREAEGPLGEALRRSPDEPVYLRALAELACELGRHGEALTLARRATEVAPERSSNFVTLGFVASAAGDKRLAREAYERAVALDPSDSAAWNNLGCLELEAGKPLLAKSRFREALRLDPRGERAQRNLSLVLQPGETARYRNWDGALEELMRELRRGHAARTTMAALLVEAPASSRGLYSREAALSGAAVALALRTMGAAALVPIGFGAAAAGVAYLTQRRRIETTRKHTREVLVDGRRAWDELWRRWLDGSLTRPSRDLEIDLLIENLALRLVQCEDE
ncbi:MAG TPA: tetratricopeptide repeat protein [Polyangia bacterium]|nr:tetratricopeptide repeat protein [Polyangia bacterium]